MAKIRNPSSFSVQFGVSRSLLTKLGVLDPVLNVDTRLFVDPMLLSESQHPEIRQGAKSFNAHFTKIVRLLQHAKDDKSIAYRSAYGLFDFPEIDGTCIGYGAASIRGHSWGPKIRRHVLSCSSETVRMGITDPDLFMLVSLLEEGVGPDLISDMATNVILKDLEKFNARIIKALKITGHAAREFQFGGGRTAKFLRNPLVKDRASPVILLPMDVLRDLPVASNWEEVAAAARANRVLRTKINTLIGKIWQAKVRKDKKADVRNKAYGSRDAFEALLAAMKEVPPKAYDAEKDPEGVLAWVRILEAIAKHEPLKLHLPAKANGSDVANIVQVIVDHYQSLIEDKGLWKELWSGTSRRPEKSAQRIFFAVADAYCKANDLDLTPEADSGVGPVDFKMSKGYRGRVLVELKLSSNSKVVTGFEKQLQAYIDAEEATHAFYVLIDVGSIGEKEASLLKVKNRMTKGTRVVSEIVVVDGTRQKSASKR